MGLNLTLSAGGGERELGLGRWWSLRTVVFKRGNIRLSEVVIKGEIENKK